MGAGQSKPPSETVIHNESAIHFSQDLVNQLSDQLANPHVTPERQATLDAQILSRIASEVAKLREQEEDVLQQIGNVLEKENIDREKALAGADSASLRHDLDAIQEHVKSFQGRQRIPKQFPEVNSVRDALIACYKANPNTELNCAQEVADFKAAVAKVEQGFVESLKST